MEREERSGVGEERSGVGEERSGVGEEGGLDKTSVGLETLRGPSLPHPTLPRTSSSTDGRSRRSSPSFPKMGS